jgi:hypothetical protein
VAVTIDELDIQIQASSTQAAAGIDRLEAALSRLRTSVRGGAGLTTVSKQLERLSQTVHSMQDPSTKIGALVAALKPLESIGKSNLGSTLNQLKKIPEITAGLDDAKLSAFADKIQQVTVAIRPLAAEMEKVSLGFSRLPANIQKAINANARLTRSNKSTAFGFNMLAAKISIIYVAMRRVASVISGWIKESNDYVENLNLFTVAMGEYAESAQAYAEKVSELMGIDPSEWMRNQGVFNTLLTGFGVAADKSALMSKNLTQLGYDLSSFFNISFAESMQKLQSGISGELEPLRRLGYDLSQAKLEAIALSLGIDRSVNSMTQAEKAQLRYVAIMTQVTTAQGDMARTLQAPANQLRILQAQITQTARALGNIFIPFLNLVLPYAIAAAQAIRLLASSIASLMGFSLPSIDYSGIESIGAGATEIADGLDNASDSAQKLKRSLLGFDELNVLSSPTGGGGGGGAGIGGGGGGFDFDLGQYDYDFLGDAINDKVEKILSDIVGLFKQLGTVLKPIVNLIKYLWPVIKNIAIVLAVSKIAKWISKLKLVSPIVKGISTVFKGAKDVATAFYLGLKNGNGITEKLKLASSHASSEIGVLGSGIAKTTGVLAGFAITAMTTYDAVKGLATGTMPLDQALVNIGVSAGGTALVLGSVFGWQVGVATAAVGLLVGALGGLMAAYIQNNTLTGAAAESLNRYADGIIRNINQSTEYSQKINEQITSLESVKASISDSSIELDYLTSKWRVAGSATETEVETMLSAAEQLKNDTITYLENTWDAIDMFLIAGWKSAGEQATESAGEVLQATSNLRSKGIAEVEAAYERLDAISEGLKNGSSQMSDSLLTELDSIFNTIRQNSGEGIAEVDRLTAAVNTMDLSGGSESVTKALGDITGAAKTAMSELETSYDQLKAQISQMGLSEGETEQVLQYLDQSFKYQQEALIGQVQEAATTLMTRYGESLKEAGESDDSVYIALASMWSRAGIDTLSKDYGLQSGENVLDGIAEGLGIDTGAIKTGAYSAYTNVENAMGDAFDMHSPAGVAVPWGQNIVAGVGKGMEKSQPVIQASAQRVVNAFDSYFNTVPPKFVEIGKKIGASIGDGVNASMPNAVNKVTLLGTNMYTVFVQAAGGTSASKYSTFSRTIPTAIGSGITANSSAAVNEGKKLIDSILRAMETAAGTRFKTLGTTLSSEFSSGLNSSSVASGVETMLNTALSRFETFCGRVRTAINTLVQSIGRAFSTLNISMGGTSFSRIPYISIPRFERGGFPDAGQLFFARESGPELVGSIGGNTAVANNQQIVQGIEQGVYRAVTSAMGNGGDTTMVFEVDGEKFAKVVVREINNTIRRTGSSPILVTG